LNARRIAAEVSREFLPFHIIIAADSGIITTLLGISQFLRLPQGRPGRFYRGIGAQRFLHEGIQFRTFKRFPPIERNVEVGIEMLGFAAGNVGRAAGG
jgi:hypothetical protein